jgi:propanol-preferring alcohol dehydrogenase
MRAFRLPGWGQAPRLEEVAVPVAGPGQVLVRVGACGLCHSDLAMMAMPADVGDALGWQIPFTLGHEAAGWVAAVGDGVDGLSIGDAVAVASPAFCGSCRWCAAGHQNRCAATMVGRGYGRDGALADHVLVERADALLPIGPLDPVQAAPLTDAGATAHHAVARALGSLEPGGTAVVIGAGGIGGFVVQLLRELRRARIIAVDPDPVRRELALSWGAAEAIDGVGPATGRELRAVLGADGAEAVIDVVGTDATIGCAVRAAGVGASVVLVGAAGGQLQRPWYGSLPRDGTITTFQGSDLTDAAAVLALAAEGRIEVPVERWPLDQAGEAYGALEAGGLRGRAVVVP